MASTDLDALVALFRSTGGGRWCERDDGDTAAELANWSGVDLNDDGRVVQLFQNENGLKGPIPEQLGVLTLLKILNLGSNNLTGAIPASLGHLGNLQQLYLSGNELTGHIPPALGDLFNLQVLVLSANKLSGQIPASLGQLVKLETLSLDRNKLSGRIPVELEALRELRKLMVEDNELSGPISPKLGNLAALQHLVLSNNHLSGPIPTELGSLSALQHLWLDGNQLSGLIPKALRALTKLETLWLSDNQLTGPVPPELGDLGTLVWINFADNQLSALWDHTQHTQDIGHAMRGYSMPGGHVPSQLSLVLDILDRTRAMRTFPGLDRNPWVEPPESIVAKGPNVIRSYFEDLYAEPCRVQRSSVKVVIVGQEGAGKTSLRQSMKANKAFPTGDWKEESTVFVEVERMELGGSSVRVYDCAGQVAYAGLLQMFLTPRSVCVLVCNAEAFGQQRGSERDDQVGEDCRKLEELRVFDWLRAISRRAPGSNVILVVTKCDLVRGKAIEFGRRIEQASRTWLASWVRNGMQPVTVEHGVCLTSCCPTAIGEDGETSTGNRASKDDWACNWRQDRNDNPSTSLPHRLVNKPDTGGPRGARMTLPRSWGIALTVLEALEIGRDPVEMVTQSLASSGGGDAAKTAGAEAQVYFGMTVEDLNTKWQEAVVELAKRKIMVVNAEHALEGALSIREFDGSVVRHETFIFLDVVWLARILKPLLNHKDEETFDGCVNLGDTGDTHVTLQDPFDIISWSRLKYEGVLEPRLARAMWPDGLSEYVLPTLTTLGLTFPLEDYRGEGWVVLLRLNPDRPERVGEVIDTFRLDQTPPFSASWKFFLGVPPGAIEKVLTRCCSLGGVRTFWRSGVLVHGNLGDLDGHSIFAVVLEHSPADNELTAQIFGDISTPAPWVALSYVASAVSLMLLDFPGLRWRGSLNCPQHGDAMPLANRAAHAGDKIVDAIGCPRCRPYHGEHGGLGGVAGELVRMVDIRLDRGVIFREVKARFVDLKGPYPFSRPAASSDGKAQASSEYPSSVVEDLRTALGVVECMMKGRLDRVLDSTQECLMRLKDLQAPNYRYPRLVAVEENACGGTWSKAHGMKRVLGKLRGVETKAMTLHFLCPVDMSKVPCGDGGEGYRFRETRDWVKKVSPVLQVAMVTAKVALQAATGLNVDISDFLKDVKDGLVEELVDRTLDEEALLRAFSGDDDIGADLQRNTWASYEALKKFMDTLEVNRRKYARDGDGYVDFRERMKRVRDGRGGMVWVRNENVQRWLDSLLGAAPSK